VGRGKWHHDDDQDIVNINHKRAFVTGIATIRSSASGKALPSPFKIAEAMQVPKKAAQGYLTTMATVWTQFVLHDISRPVSFSGKFTTDWRPKKP
jgi:hypothetical protein